MRVHRVFFLFCVHALFAGQLSLQTQKDPGWREIGTVSICEDLTALAKSTDHSATLVIDKIHRFHDFPEYGLSPSLNWIKGELLKINPAYQFWILGDFAVVTIDPTPPTELVKACTVSRFFVEGDPVDAVIAAERTIRDQAKWTEAKAFDRLTPILVDDPTYGVATAHILLWKGLVAMGRKYFWDGSQLFERLRSLGYHDWRIGWYLADCYFCLGEDEQARDFAREVLEIVPDFFPAKIILH